VSDATNSIIDRISYAVRVAGERGFRGIRCLSLTEEDHKALKDELGIRRWACIQEYRGIEIRRAKHSNLWSRQSVSVRIPRKLPTL
jgi:hypothetical protein